MVVPAWVDRPTLRADGLTDGQIDAGLRDGRWVQVARGVYVPADSADLWQRCGAALSTQHPDALISRRTAAVAHQFPWLPEAWAESAISLDAPREDKARSSRAGLDRHLSEVPPQDVATWSGLRITGAARTAVDLARFEHRAVVVPILDGLLTEKRCSREELVAVMDRMTGIRFIRRARSFVDASRAGVGSPRETATRLQIIDAGLPEPDVNLLLFEHDLCVAQGDLGYWRWMIWIEYDGYDPHIEGRLSGEDEFKTMWLGRRGWHVFRLTNRDHYRPRDFLESLRLAIADAPARIMALPADRSPELARAQQLLQPFRRS